MKRLKNGLIKLKNVIKNKSIQFFGFIKNCILGFINFIRNKFYLEYIKHYIKLTGIKIERIEQWELPVAAARLIEWLPKDEKVSLLNFINKKMEEIK